jgi:hypothetical protein
VRERERESEREILKQNNSKHNVIKILFGVKSTAIIAMPSFYLKLSLEQNLILAIALEVEAFCQRCQTLCTHCMRAVFLFSTQISLIFASLSLKERPQQTR